MMLTTCGVVSYRCTLCPNTTVFLTEWNTFRSWSVPPPGPHPANDACLDLQRQLGPR